MDANIWKDFEPNLCEPVVSPKRLLVSCVGWESPQRLPKGSFLFFACIFVCGCAYEGMCVHMYVCVYTYVQVNVHVCASVCKRPEDDVTCPLQ